MNMQLILNNIPQLLQGTLVTLELMICSLIVGLIIAIFFSMAAQSRHAFLRFPISGFTFFIRGTPLLVQIFLIYYGSGQSEWIRESFLWAALQKPFVCAVIALSLNTSAYTTELIRGAIRAIPRGEIEACQALGMSYFLLMRKIILPRVLRLLLPAYSNEVIMILKSTTLASTITLMDIMGMTRKIVAENYAAIEFFLVTAIIYLVLNAIIVWLFRKTEAHFAH